MMLHFLKPVQTRLSAEKFILHFRSVSMCIITSCWLLVPSLYLAKLEYIWQIFKLDFLRNEASYEKILFYISNLFFHVILAPVRLYYDYRPTLFKIKARNKTQRRPMTSFSLPWASLTQNTRFWFQKGVQKLQVSQGGASTDLDGGGRSLGTRPRSWSADGHGHGFSERGRWFFSPGTFQESRATGSARPRPSRGSDASSEALAERRWQRMRARRVHVGPARPQARSSKKITYSTCLEYWHNYGPSILSLYSGR